MAAVTICSDFGAPQNKLWHCFHCFPSISHEVMGPDAMILVFWIRILPPGELIKGGSWGVLLPLPVALLNNVLSGEFVISLVLFCHSKNLKWQTDQYYSCMLQLSFIWQAKKNTSLWHEGVPTWKKQKEEKPPGQFWLLFLYVFFFFFFLLPQACPM